MSIELAIQDHAAALRELAAAIRSAHPAPEPTHEPVTSAKASRKTASKPTLVEEPKPADPVSTVAEADKPAAQSADTAPVQAAAEPDTAESVPAEEAVAPEAVPVPVADSGPAPDAEQPVSEPVTFEQVRAVLTPIITTDREKATGIFKAVGITKLGDATPAQLVEILNLAKAA